MTFLVSFLSTKALPMLYTIIGFGSLITVHEFGHFIFCKLFGIHTPTFSIGFGPELISRKIGTTHFRLALLPFGGYVEIAGHSEVGQGDQEFAQSQENNSFAVKPYWQKFLVLMGGIIFNLLFAFFVFTGLFYFGTNNNQDGIIISRVIPGSAAEEAGLKEQDVIIAINDISLQKNSAQPEKTHVLLLDEIRKHPSASVSMTIKRSGEQAIHSVKLGTRLEGTQEIGTLGANFDISYYADSLFDAFYQGGRETTRWLFVIAAGIKNLIGQRSLEGAGGPIMMMSHTFSSVQVGFIPFFIFLAVFSINLALVNLLPFGIVDGGQLLFITIEAIIRRPIPDIIKLAINLISFALFIGLFIFLTYKDLMSLFGERIFYPLYNKVVSVLFNR